MTSAAVWRSSSGDNTTAPLLMPPDATIVSTSLGSGEPEALTVLKTTLAESTGSDLPSSALPRAEAPPRLPSRAFVIAEASSGVGFEARNATAFSAALPGSKDASAAIESRLTSTDWLESDIRSNTSTLFRPPRSARASKAAARSAGPARSSKTSFSSTGRSSSIFQSPAIRTDSIRAGPDPESTSEASRARSPAGLTPLLWNACSRASSRRIRRLAEVEVAVAISSTRESSSGPPIDAASEKSACLVRGSNLSRA